MNRFRWILPFALLLSFLAGCGLLSPASTWTRSDMPIDGMEQVVVYNLNGTAGTDREVNRAKLRGLNENAPFLGQEVIFDRMSGSKTQDVQIRLPDGRVMTALGMVKTERFGGLTKYMSLESATISGVDANGQAVCGAKIRLQFNRNATQYLDPNKRDWDSIWYYSVPCSQNGNNFTMDIENGTLQALVINEVWQARIAAGSFFFNWGHSVTITGGPAANLRGAWWTRWETAQQAYNLVNDSVAALESSSAPWAEMGGNFAGACIVYSSGDADQFANLDRVFLNRQKEYAVIFRPDCTTAWKKLIIRPVYNLQWNDIGEQIAAIRGLNAADPLQNKLDENGYPSNINDPVVKEIQTNGWINAPNTSLEQIQFIDADSNTVLYAMTVRAFLGANDTLVMFGPPMPDLSQVQASTPQGAELPIPVLYDERGKPLAADQQPYTSEQWAAWQREATMWNFLKQGGVRTDLMVQYRFKDNTEYAPITCTDSDGDSYTCGYRPVEWDLSTSYYMSGDTRKPWVVSQLLGEVGVRTLGMSYASGLYQGTGMLFALGQAVHRDEFFAGYNQESIWTFDARASQLPGRLREAYSYLQ